MERNGDWKEVLKLLFSPDLRTSEQAEQTLKSQLSTSGDWYGVIMEEYVATGSGKLCELLAGVREPQEKAFLDALGQALNTEEGRIPAIALLSRVVQQQASWVPKLPSHRVFSDVLRLLKNPRKAVEVVSGLFLLAALLPHSPLVSSEHLRELLIVMLKTGVYAFRLTAKAPSAGLERPAAIEATPHLLRVYEQHVVVAFQAYFQRMYGMFPCNVQFFLREQMETSSELRRAFPVIFQPLLASLRMHPGLITGSRASELSKERWAKREPHDFLSACSRLSLPTSADSPSLAAGPPSHFSLRSTASLSHSSLGFGHVASTAPSPLKPVESLQRRNSRGAAVRPADKAWSEADALERRHTRARRNISAAIIEGEDVYVANHEDQSELTSESQGGVEMGAAGSAAVAAELWSPSMAVGLETPPDSKRTTPVSAQMLGRRESLQRGFSNSGGPEAARSGAALGGGFNARKSFTNAVKDSVSGLFRRNTSDSHANRDAWLAQQGGSSGSVPPSPMMRPVNSPPAFGFEEQGPAASSGPEQAEEAVETPQPVRKALSPQPDSLTLDKLEAVASQLRGKAASNAEADEEVTSLLQPPQAPKAQHVTRIPISPKGSFAASVTPTPPPNRLSSLGAEERRPSIIREQEESVNRRIPSVGEYFKLINRKRFQSECATNADDSTDTVFEHRTGPDVQAPLEPPVSPTASGGGGDARGRDAVRVGRKRSSSLPHRLSRAALAALARARDEIHDDQDTPRHQPRSVHAPRPPADALHDPFEDPAFTELLPRGRKGGESAKGIAQEQGRCPLSYDDWVNAMSRAYPYLPLLPAALPFPPPLPHDGLHGASGPSSSSGLPLPSLTASSVGDSLRPAPPTGLELPTMHGGGSLDEYFAASKGLYDARSAESHWVASDAFASLQSSEDSGSGQQRKEPGAASVAPTSSTSSSSQGRHGAGPAHAPPDDPSSGPPRRPGQPCCVGAAEAELLRHRLEFERSARLSQELRERRLFVRLKTEVRTEVQAETERVELLHLRGERDQLTRWLTELRKSKIDLESQKSTLEYRAKEAELRLNKDKDRLSSQLISARRSAESSEGEAAVLSVDVAKLQNELFETKSSLNLLQSSASEVERLAAERAEHLKELEWLRQLHAETLPILDAYKREVIAREATEAKYDTLAFASKRESNNLRKDLRREKNRSDSLKAQALELESQLTAKMEELNLAQEAETLLQNTQSDHLRALEHRHRALLATSARQEGHIADLYRTIAELSYGKAPTDAATASVAIPACQSAHREITSYGSWNDVGRQPKLPPPLLAAPSPSQSSDGYGGSPIRRRQSPHQSPPHAKN